MQFRNKPQRKVNLLKNILHIILIYPRVQKISALFYKVPPSLIRLPGLCLLVDLLLALVGALAKWSYVIWSNFYMCFLLMLIPCGFSLCPSILLANSQIFFTKVFSYWLFICTTSKPFEVKGNKFFIWNLLITFKMLAIHTKGVQSFIGTVVFCFSFLSWFFCSFFIWGLYSHFLFHLLKPCTSYVNSMYSLLTILCEWEKSHFVFINHIYYIVCTFSKMNERKIENKSNKTFAETFC